MKKNRQFLWALMVLVLPFSMVACSDDEKNDPTPDPDPTAGLTAIKFSIPDFKDSYVYLVKDGDKSLAEICSEYVLAFSATERATVVYPVGSDGKIDHTKGLVVNNGGSISWGVDSCVYQAGTAKAITVLYVDSCKLKLTAEPLKTVTATPDKLKDADNNEYKIVKIGTQYWLGENFKSTKAGDGSALAMNLSVADWCSNTTGAAILFQVEQPGEGEDPLSDDLSTPAKIKANYGLLYNWIGAKKAAPAGWHLPSVEEWEKLANYLEDGDAAGGMLKEEGLTRWNPYITWEWVGEGDDEQEVQVNKGNVGATNVTGFTAVGAGYIYSQWSDMSSFSFGQPKQNTYWWTSSKDENDMVGCVSVENQSASLWYEEQTTEDSNGAFPVRIVRD